MSEWLDECVPDIMDAHLEMAYEDQQAADLEYERRDLDSDWDIEVEDIDPDENDIDNWDSTPTL